MRAARARAPVVLAVLAALMGVGGGEVWGADAAGAPGTAAPPPLEDNGFLVEEAYNQEARVVQHIFNWARFEPSGDHVLAFSQEWPLFGQRHQLAYSIPFQSLGGASRGTGWGDVEIQYRYQWLGIDGSPLAAAPEFTLLLPTGDPGENLGAGAAGGEVGLPLSARLSSRFVAHTNLSVTYTGENGGTPARMEYDLGQSLVWLMASRFNPLVELTWSRSEPAGGGAGAEREEIFLVSPGFRWGHDFESGLQIVPGIAFPIGIGASSGDAGVLLYLSFEHGF
jgi:hypothetical protein